MPERPVTTKRQDANADVEPEQTDPHVRASNLRTRVFALIISGGVSGLGLGATAYAYEKLRDVAHDAGVDGAKVVVGDIDETKRAVKVIDADLQQHKADEARDRLEVKGELHDVRVELRELYKAQMEGKRSAVLEQPVPAKDAGR